VAVADRAVPMLAGMEAGWTQSLESLTEQVARSVADREIVLTRDFDAPRE
jgi:uncharacterized protein YndB with AHSA1/START domain